MGKSCHFKPTPMLMPVSELFRVEELALAIIESGHRARTTELKSFLGSKLV